jgi:hypothetical protein
VLGTLIHPVACFYFLTVNGDDVALGCGIWLLGLGSLLLLKLYHCHFWTSREGTSFRNGGCGQGVG